MNMIRSLFLGVSLLGAVSATANDQIQVRGPGFYHAVEVGKSPPLIEEAAGVRILGYDPETDPTPAVADRLAVPHRAVSGTASTQRLRPVTPIRYGTGRGYAPGIRYGNGVRYAPRIRYAQGIRYGSGSSYHPGTRYGSGVRYGSGIRYDKIIVYGSDTRYSSNRRYATGVGYNRPAKR